MVRIIHSTDMVAAIEIGGDQFIIRLDYNYPEIYDKNGRKLNIPNIDTYINRLTHQKFSYNMIIELCKSYNHGYTNNPLKFTSEVFIKSIVKEVIKQVFRTNRASEYVSLYWIECMPKFQLFKKIITPLRDNYDYFLNKLGMNKLINYANRVRKTCTDTTDLNVIIKIFDKHNIEQIDPIYPDTSDLDDEIIGIIIHRIQSAESSIVKDANQMLLDIQARLK